MMELQALLKLLLSVSITLSCIGGFISFLNRRDSEYYNNRKLLWLFAISGIIILLFLGIRAYLKSFFPFTDKVESFVTLYFLLIATGLIYRKKLNGGEFAAVVYFGIISAATVFIFKDRINYPTPYLRTFWYPLHVPLSFLSYAFWITAGIKSFFIIISKDGDSETVSSLNRNGFIFFSIAMIFGGIWGYLAWGAYFLWDPKILWSVILWIFYGNMLHMDFLPLFRRWKHPLFLVGVILILITFIGTGFFTRSIHRF